MEIKQLEVQKQEILKELALNNQSAENEERQKKIDEIKLKLQTANRMEIKYLNKKLSELEAEKNKALKEVEKIEDQIEKKQTRIDKLGEQSNKTSIKNQMLGKIYLIKFNKCIIQVRMQKRMSIGSSKKIKQSYF